MLSADHRSDREQPVRWRLLGPLEARTPDGWTGLGAAKLRGLLAVLLTEPSRAVSTERLIGELWADTDPPAGCRKLVSQYVHRLRRLTGDPAGQVLVTEPPGYRLAAARMEVDAGRFADQLAAAQAARARRDARRAADLAADALRLWRGPALADVPRGPLLAAEAHRLDELRLDALELRAEAALAQGQAARQVAELRALTDRHPLRERFWLLLMRALDDSGRPAEALAAYAQARQFIADELGTDPSLDLQQLHHRLLTRDATPARKATPAQPGSSAVPVVSGHRPAATAMPGPRQLPGAVRIFTGRAGELGQLSRLAEAAADDAATVTISAISGTAGVGKTALAVYWAHQVAGRFPDGQLYVNLRGYDPDQPVPPAQALAGFLRTLGVPGQDIPAEADQRAGQYRSLLAGRRMLVLLDNAGSAEQVRPLLPGTPGCMALVTSRDALPGLVARDGATRLDLDLLPPADAAALLTRLIGNRATADPHAVAELAAQCARLPLALRVAAELATAHPAASLAELTAELADQQHRLERLDSGGDTVTEVRAVFSWSYHHLSEPAARMFRLLGLHPGPDISVPAAASLAATSLPDTQRALRELTRAQLIAERVPGRYAFHDLLRAYAATQARDVDSEAERGEAIGRVLDHYLHTAAHGYTLIDQGRESVTLAAPRPGAAPEQFAGHEQAIAWFAAEHQVLLAAANLAAGSGLCGHAWQIPWAIAEYLGQHGHYQEIAATQRAALAAATHLGDIAGQAVSSRLLAKAHSDLGDYAQALGCYSASLELYRRLGNRRGEANIHVNLSVLAEGQGRFADALAHAEQALRRYQAIASTTGEASALNAVGWYHGLLGDYERARAFCQQALALSEEADYRRLTASIWDSLGYIEHHMGNFGEAATCYQRACGIFRGLGDSCYEAVTLAHLGDTCQAAGDLAQARTAWRQSLAILEDMRHPDAAQVRAKLRACLRTELT